MTAKDVLDWWPLLVAVVGWSIIASTGWTKMQERVNGLGGRVTQNSNDILTERGRVDRMEREIDEYRRDAQEAKTANARVEKAVEEVHDAINQGNLQLGSQLHAMEKSIQEKDVRTQVRLTRIETVAKIEDKIGPLPAD